jgi:hypothetical protein
VRRFLASVRAALGGTSPQPAGPAASPPPAVPRPGGPAPTARRVLEYTPVLDGDADPGEVVWAWVAYEDDPSQGKDRPALVVGRDGADGGDIVLALMLSSQDYHEGDPAWLSLGSGAWDGEGRPSWVRLDRVLELPADGIRREGAILDGERFDRVAAALRAGHGWT